MEMSGVKHKTGGNVHHCSRVHKFLQLAVFLLGGGGAVFICLSVSFFFFLNTPVELDLLCLVIK